jgi:hypothetical protein
VRGVLGSGGGGVRMCVAVRTSKREVCGCEGLCEQASNVLEAVSGFEKLDSGQDIADILGAEELAQCRDRACRKARRDCDTMTAQCTA